MQLKESSTRSEKVVLLGPSSSGKTSLVSRLISEKFDSSSKATIGAALASKTFQIDGEEIKLDIWDTGGSEKYKALAPMYYRDARGVVIVYDVTNQSSLDEAQNWLDQVRDNGQEQIVIVAAANKCDVTEERELSEEKANDFGFVNQLDAYLETSAKTGHNVHQLFESLAVQLLKLPPLPSLEKQLNPSNQPVDIKCEQPSPFFEEERNRCFC